MVRRRHHRQHRIAAERRMVGQQDDRVLVRWHLHRAGHHALRVELVGRPPFRSQVGHPTLRPQPDPDAIAVRQGAGRRSLPTSPCVRLELFGMRTGHDTKLHGLAAAFDLRRGTRQQMVGERRRPRACMQTRAGADRPGAESGQLVARAAREDLGPEETARDRQVGAATPLQPPHLELLPAQHGQDLARLLRRAVEAECGRGAHGGDVARRHTPQQRPAAGQLQGARAGHVADEPIGQGEGDAIGGGRVGTPSAATPRRPPSCTTARSPGATTSSTQRAAAGEDQSGTRTGAGWSGSPAPASVNLTRSPGLRTAYRGTLG